MTIAELKTLISNNQKSISIENALNGNLQPPRTQANNAKLPFSTIAEERSWRADLVTPQIKAWNTLVPKLLHGLSKITDIRRPKSIKHKLIVLLLYGILMFVFRIKSCRDFNAKMSRPQMIESLKAIFPEIDSSPHSISLSRILKTIDPLSIESAHMQMIKELIKKKKFKALLINGMLPISIDGVQKVVRNGVLEDYRWLQRSIKSSSGEGKQQYVYVLEVNITMRNGLTIPLITEFLSFDGNPNVNKQDCELTAISRVLDRLKIYFPRQNIVILLDKLYANSNVISYVTNNHWNFLIVLPNKKLKIINKHLDDGKLNISTIPGCERFRGRKQKWCFSNEINLNKDISVNAILCLESWKEVSKDDGEIALKHSEHRWITNIFISAKNVHIIANMVARKRWGIEDSNNTEKNRGYNYTHLYSHDWNAMQCYHLLMRIGHAINALSEFTKGLRGLIKSFGCSRILDFLVETLCNPWLDKEWLHEISTQRASLTLEI